MLWKPEKLKKFLKASLSLKAPVSICGGRWETEKSLSSIRSFSSTIFDQIIRQNTSKDFRGIRIAELRQSPMC
jgi:hypothetical protein